MKDLINNYCDEHELDNVLFIDGHDNAIMGLSTCFNSVKVVYSYKKIIGNLTKDMNHEDAEEFFEYNIRGAYLGDGTPIIMQDNIDWNNYKS